jgi:hypothetical protein
VAHQPFLGLVKSLELVPRQQDGLDDIVIRHCRFTERTFS